MDLLKQELMGRNAELKNAEKEIKGLLSQASKLQSNLKEAVLKSETLTQLNEELRSLIEQEREVQASEIVAVEEKIEKTRQQGERRVGVIKSKLLILLSAWTLGGS